MPDVTQPNAGFIPFASPQGPAFAPQGFDFGQLIQQIAGQVIPALPNLIASVLSANPTLGTQLKAQSASVPGIQPGYTPQGYAPHSYAPQSYVQQGFGPQGFDFGHLAQQVASQVLPALPGLLLGLLSSHPVIGPQLQRQGVSAAPGMTPQSAFGPGQNAQWGGTGFNVFGAVPTPGFGGTPNAGFGAPATGFGIGSTSGIAAAPAGFAPQGFDFGQFAQQLASQVAPALPGLILGLLSANPMLSSQQQQARPHTTH